MPVGREEHDEVALVPGALGAVSLLERVLERERV